MNTHNYRPWLFASLVCFIVEIDAATSGDGVLMAFNTNATVKLFCLKYFPELFQLPLSGNALAHSLIDLTSWSGCELNGDTQSLQSHHVGLLHGEVIVVERKPNCSILDEVKMVEKLGGSGVIVIDSRQLLPTYNQSQHINLNISLAIISNDSYQHIKALGPDVKVIQYAAPSKLDLSLLVVWLIALLCVVLGAYWESIVRRIITRLPVTQHDAFPGEADIRRRTSSSEQQHKQEIVHLSSPQGVLILVACMSIMLLLIYFFYSFLVYVLIAFYCLGCASSLYQLTLPFLVLAPIGKLWIRKLLLFLLWASVSITWLVLRKQSYAWILQNFLSIALMTNVLNVLRFPSFKIITILLMLLFLYDIFFVFITPLLTKNGESVMVQAASGGSGGGGGFGGGSEVEQMPMIFKVPNFNSYSICELHYLVLGLGDVLFPGLLVGYCFRFQPESRLKLYFISSVVAYGCGLLLTFFGLFLMASAQPALLYLVPTMLVTSAIVALVRKEFNSFWTGTLVENQSEDDDNSTINSEVEVADNTVIAYDSVCESVISENSKERC